MTAFLTLEIRQGSGPRRGRPRTSPAIPEVLEAHTITGAGDMWARVVARSNSDLQRVIDRVLGDPGIVRSSTVIALEQQVAVPRAASGPGGQPMSEAGGARRCGPAWRWRSRSRTGRWSTSCSTRTSSTRTRRARAWAGRSTSTSCAPARCAGTPSPTRMSPVRVAGATAVLTGVVVDDVVVDGDRHVLRFATTQTYVLRRGALVVPRRPHLDHRWLRCEGRLAA